MESRLVEIHPEKVKAELEKKKVLYNFTKVATITFVAIIIAFVCFAWNNVEWFEWESSVDNELLGTFGDFIGGVLGTIIALYSIYMLVKTLQNQVDSNADMKITNEEVVRTNKIIIDSDTLQLFDNKFQIFFNQYKEAFIGYDADGKNGRKNFELLVEDFLKSTFTNNQDYKRKNIAAVNLYEDFYSEHRRELSVHFRLLYLLVRHLAEASRVQYAKCIRGQLSDGELVLLRYNCQTQNGMAMRPYVNHFNLLKHIPLMSLFEFRRWSNMIADSHERSALDGLFITLKKIMTSGLDDKIDGSKHFEISSRYKFSFTFNESHTEMIFSVDKDKQKKVGGGIKRPYAEKALDRVPSLQLPLLFYAFLHESYITGNFGLFSNSTDCVNKPIILKNDPNNLLFEIRVKSETKLALAASQVVPSIG